MENTTLIIVVVTNIILVIVLGGFGFLIYKLLKDQKSVAPPAPPVQAPPTAPLDPTSFHPEIVKRMQYLEGVKAKRAELACPNHPSEPGETVCAICDLHFCHACVKPFKSMYLCKEHFPMVMASEWGEVITVKASSADPEKGVKLYDLKKELFRDCDVPAYVETHYKINVDQDAIETYLVLFAKNEDVPVAKAAVQDLQA